MPVRQYGASFVRAWLSAFARAWGYEIVPAGSDPHAVDQLTGLMTRPTLLRALEARFGLPRREGNGVAVLRIDIDELERINEALSLAAGDQVVADIARRITGLVGSPELVARIAGAAFVALLPDAETADDAAELAHRIRVAVAEPVVAHGHLLQPTVSIGIAFDPLLLDGELALQNAALAVRRAKDGGGDRVEFADADLAVRAMRRLELEEAMRQALMHSEFRAWYQPIVDINDGSLMGYEALIRWIREDGVQIGPAEFIPVSEMSGMVSELDLIVLAQSLGLLSQLPGRQYLSVNVSPASLMRPDFVRRAAQLLEFAQVDLSRLHLEVTETALPADLDVIRSAMLHLSLGGARWFFDDFGTGYSSMSNLGELPVDGLKLDMSFTRGIHAGDQTSIRLAQGLLGLAQGLELDTIAEGVETETVAQILREQGWEQGQGWLYGKAAPLSAA